MRAVIDTNILIDYLAGVEAARDELADPGVRVPYTIASGDFS